MPSAIYNFKVFREARSILELEQQAAMRYFHRNTTDCLKIKGPIELQQYFWCIKVACFIQHRLVFWTLVWTHMD